GLPTAAALFSMNAAFPPPTRAPRTMRRLPIVALLALFVSLFSFTTSFADDPPPRLVRVPFASGMTYEKLLDAGLDVIGKEAGGFLVIEWQGDAEKLAAIGANAVLVDPDPG